MKKTERKSGFTLVELMVVAAIIAILAAIIVPLLTKNKDTAIASEGQNICGAVLTAAKTQYARTSTWPSYATLDDTILTDEIDNQGNWSVTALSGPSPAVITVSGGQGDISGTITLTDGKWSGDGSFAFLTEEEE